MTLCAALNRQGKLLLLPCFRLTSAQHVCTFPPSWRDAEGMQPDTSRKPSLLFMPGHASLPGLHCCHRCHLRFPFYLLLLQPTVSLCLAAITWRATKWRSIWMVAVWRELRIKSVWRLVWKQKTRGDDDTEQRVRTGNTGSSVWMQIVSVVPREFGLEGFRHMVA